MPSEPRRPSRPLPTGAAPCNPGRALAFDRLATEAARYPDLGLDSLDDARLDRRDAALANAIYDAAVRRWLTISRLAGLFLRQHWTGLEPGVQAALLGGAAQCLFFDRIPIHAAIDEAVEWTKAASGKGASGLVNAVLRRVAELPERDGEGTPVRRERWANTPDELPMPDGGALALKRAAFQEDDLPRIGAATGIPVWQVERWADQFGTDDAEHIAWHALTTGPTLVHAPGGRPEHPALEPHETPSHHVFLGTRPELQTLLADNPHAWVQDPTAAAAIELLGDIQPSRVVDLCAGRGTKTRQLLHRFPEAVITACEVSTDRLRDLKTLAEGHAGRLDVARPAQLAKTTDHRADLIVADVPCSNSGVLARRVEARHRCSAKQLRRITEQQREILTLARGMLAPGGKLLYSTCSLEREENQAMTVWAGRTLQLDIREERLTLPAGGPGRSPSEYRDGGYAAVLVASG